MLASAFAQSIATTEVFKVEVATGAEEAGLGQTKDDLRSHARGGVRVFHH
jgi:hypothetical protein